MRNATQALALTFLGFLGVSVAKAAAPRAANADEPQAAAGGADKVAGNAAPAAQGAKRAGDAEKLRFCDEVKSWEEMPKDQHGHAGCRGRNVWQPLCQTPDAPYEKGTKKLQPGRFAPLPTEKKQPIAPAEAKVMRTVALSPRAGVGPVASHALQRAPNRTQNEGAALWGAAGRSLTPTRARQGWVVRGKPRPAP